MARVPEDHVTIQCELWIGLVLCSNIYINCLVHELHVADMWKLWNLFNVGYLPPQLSMCSGAYDYISHDFKNLL